MAQIGINISVSGLTGFLLVRWVKASSPLAEVGRSSAFTYPVDTVYTIPNLLPVVYIVQLWRSDDGIALDQLIKDWSIDASKESQTIVKYFQYKVGRGFNNVNQSTGSEVWADPADTDYILVDERLAGYTKDQMIVQESGYGNHLDADYNLYAGGGIELLGGKTFDQDVTWTITVFETQLVTVPATQSGGLYDDVEVITADRDFFVDANDNLYNKLCPVNGAGSTVQVTFPDLTLIPDDTYITFTTHHGTQNYLILQFDAGDTVRFNNADVNVIYLAKNEKITLYFKEGVCYVIDYDGNAAKRGTIQYDHDAARSDNGALLYADEATGELDKADYPGLYKFIEGLSGSAVCNLGTSVGEWSYFDGTIYPNKQKFGINTTAETCRVPHLDGLVAKLSSTPGVYQADQVGAFNITGYYIKKVGSSHTIIALGVPGAPVTGTPPDVTHGTQNIPVNAGQETRVKSFSQKPYVIL